MKISSVCGTENHSSNPNFGLKLFVTKAVREAFKYDKPKLRYVNFDRFESALSQRVASIEPKNEPLLMDVMNGYSSYENMFKLNLRGAQNTYGYNETASIGQNVDWLVGGSLVDLRKMANVY